MPLTDDLYSLLLNGTNATTLTLSSWTTYLYDKVFKEARPPEVQEARLIGNRLTDVTALLSFTKLHSLWLSNNELTHLPTSEMTWLEKLCLDTNKLTSLAGIEKMVYLKKSSACAATCLPVFQS